MAGAKTIGPDHNKPCTELVKTMERHEALSEKVTELEDLVAERRTDDKEFKTEVFKRLDAMNISIQDLRAGRPSWAVTWIISTMATVIGILVTTVIALLRLIK